MKQLNKPFDNLGGLVKIWAIPASQFLAVGNSFSIGDTNNIYELYCSPDSMQYSTYSEKSIEGTIYNATIKGFAPGNTDLLEITLRRMMTQKWVIITLDGNGKYLLAGSRRFPLTLSSKVDTGLDTSFRAGCKFSFSGKIPYALQIVGNPF